MDQRYRSILYLISTSTSELVRFPISTLHAVLNCLHLHELEVSAELSELQRLRVNQVYWYIKHSRGGIFCDMTMMWLAIRMLLYENPSPERT